MDVRFQDVRFRHHDREVLSIPSLHLQPGRATAVLGPNGAGKTTLLRLIAGLERPQTGRVLVNGARADPKRGCVAYVFQEDVFLHCSVLDNLTLALTLRGVNRAEARDRAAASLRRLGIEALADRRADRMSGGEARRASLARALCLRAAVLLLDEPMAGLDGSTYARLLDELPPLIAGSAATTLVVTHVRDEAFTFCADLLILVNGEVRAVGSKQEIAHNPRHRDVAEVLGYNVLTVAGQLLAIPDGALRRGSGYPQFTATVDGIIDFVSEWDVIATIGEVRVHVRMPRHDEPPRIGAQITLHPLVTYPLC
jgi:ABC-type sulfate/molybdate transport systems ATPase subunit